ncbi:MAG TPA: alpha/beta hydrolase [Herminiimonas sp.]|nr:alpha/beta hydrolase [Herminiimonas sp.]
MPTSIVKSRLDVIEDVASCTNRSAVLIVFLPGAYDKPQDFVDHGFVRALRDRHVAADVVMVDMHVGYYTADQAVERLREDIVLPAQQKGYAHIWLVGISLGGYGALLYSRLYANDIAGLFLMAPFMGNRTLLSEIAKAGLAEWSAGEIGPEDCDRVLWSWLQGYSRENQSGHPPLYIGYGTEDRFARSNRTLAEVLPATHVITTHGGHEWAPWFRLWTAFLDCAAPLRHA